MPISHPTSTALACLPLLRRLKLPSHVLAPLRSHPRLRASPTSSPLIVGRCFAAATPTSNSALAPPPSPPHPAPPSAPRCSVRASTSSADEPVTAAADPPLGPATIATADPTVPSSPPPPPTSLPRGLEWERRHPHDELCQRAFAGKDVLTCMRLEHRLLDWLWQRYRDVEDPDRLQRLVADMRRLLLQHLTCEERAVYDVVARESEAAALLVQQLTKDHFALRGALYRLEALTVNEEGFGLYVSWSYRHYAAHADREERELLPLLQRKSAQELLDMGVKWNVTRAMIADRPPDSLYSPEAIQWVRERLDKKEAAGETTSAASPPPPPSQPTSPFTGPAQEPRASTA